MILSSKLRDPIIDTIYVPPFALLHAFEKESPLPPLPLTNAYDRQDHLVSEAVGKELDFLDTKDLLDPVDPTTLTSRKRSTIPSKIIVTLVLNPDLGKVHRRARLLWLYECSSLFHDIGVEIGLSSHIDRVHFAAFDGGNRKDNIESSERDSRWRCVGGLI